MLLSQQPNQWSSHIGPSLTNSFDPHRYNTDNQLHEGPSLLTGPIPAAPGYEGNGRASSAPCSSRGVARVHGIDAKTIHKRHTNGTGVPFLFQVQGKGLSSTNGTSTKPPKNHMNENRKRIRQVMREAQNRQATKEQAKPTPVKALWRSKQYDHVQSKVKQTLEEDTQRSLSRPQSAQNNFLRAHENTGPHFLRPQSVEGRRDSIASSVHSSRRGSTSDLNTGAQLDYVKLNSKWAKNIPKVRKTMSTEVVEQVREKQQKELQAYHENQKGRVPDYIEKIKEKRDQEAYNERANAPDPECPSGHAKVADEQRLSTLQQLRLNQAELMKKLSHMPIRNDSLTLRRTKEDIEKKIVELDEAIKIFSKPKVFIKLEE